MSENVETVTGSDLDFAAFEAEFFGTSTPIEPDPTPDANAEEAPDEPTADAEHNEEEDLDPVDDTDAPDEPDPAEPKKKSRYQERIDQLNEKARLATELADAEARQRKALEDRLAKLEAEATKAAPTPKEKTAPHWEDKNEDGSDKYPLGQFDPDFARDHIKHTLEVERDEMRKQEEISRAERERQEAAIAADEAWKEKLAPAQERYPDFAQKGEGLLQAFSGLDQNYGEYLTSTIMGMEYGPDVLYYLSNNLTEAQRIVGLGAVGATIALGRIENTFAAAEDKATQSRRVTEAPPPPPSNKGSVAAMPEIAGDTDDFEAFEALMFKKPRR